MTNFNKTKEKLNLFVIIENLICAGIIFTTCTGNASITSLIFALSFLVLLFEFIRVFLNKQMQLLERILFIIITVAGINVIINSLFTTKNINFEYFKCYFIFSSTIMLFGLSIGIKLNRRTCNWVFFIQILICLIYIYTYNFVPNLNTNLIMSGLTLNFSNPNLTGMFLLQSVLFMSIGVLYFKRTILKLICGALLLIMIKYTLETGARNAIIAYSLFLVISIIYFLKRDFKMPKWFSVFLNCVPLIFVPLYLGTIDFINNSGWFDFLISEGKNLNSRVNVWNMFFDRFDNSWIIGNYANCMGNAHNAHLVLLFSYGVFVLILTLVFNSLITIKMSKNITNRFQGFGLAAFFATVFMGIGEGSLYSGGVGLYIFPAIFIMLANTDFQKM